jgi:hypothetical protein
MGRRFSDHHVEGRRNDPHNKVRLPVETHARVHFEQFLGTGKEGELDAFWGQFGNLTPAEKENCYREIREKTGVKIKFY